MRELVTSAICILCLLTANTAVGQDTLTTRSGQIVVVQSDGNYTVLPPSIASPAVATPDTESGSTDASVFEIPTHKSIALQPAQERLHSALTTTLQANEVQLLLEKRATSEKLAAAKLIKSDSGKKYAKALKGELKRTTKSYMNVSDRLRQLKKLKASPNSKVDKKLNKIKEYTELNVGPLSTEPAPPVVKPEFADAKLPADTQTATIEDPASPSATGYATTFTTESKKRDGMSSCRISFEGKDPATGKNKKEVAQANFFNFTQPKLKPYFKAEDFLTADAYLTKIGKDYFLTLEIMLRSKDASKSYGSINLNSELRLQFVDGDESILYSIVQDYGEIEPYSGHTLYTAVYPLNNDAITYMSKKLVDTAGIMWSSGFEQYDIYQVDFLKEQMNCLKNGTYSKK